MNRRFLRGLVAVVAALCVIQGAGPGATVTLAAGKTKALHYTHTDLDVPQGDAGAYATGIDASGPVVGSSYDTPNYEYCRATV